jgi:hypothetical protein
MTRLLAAISFPFLLIAPWFPVRASDSAETPPISLCSVARRTLETLWQPPVEASWQIVLSSNVTAPFPSVSVFDLDLFDNSASTIVDLHKNNIKAICYFSAGSFEDWRPDANNFTASDYGNPLDGWPGEYWLNTSSTNVRNIMLVRLDLAAVKGCDGVDPDNTDGYDNDNGLGLTENTAVNYVRFLAKAAHDRGLSVGLKNSGDIIPRVIDLMQWAVNEECVFYDECNVTRPFINAGKPVFGIEYPSGAPNLSKVTEDKICDDPQRANFSTLLKERSLNLWYYACPFESLNNNTSTSTAANIAGKVLLPRSLLDCSAVAWVPLLSLLVLSAVSGLAELAIF